MTLKPCKLTIRDEVSCFLSGVPINVIRAFERTYRWQMPGAHFSPAKRLGRWDGYINLFKNGNFYINLIDDKFIDALARFGYYPEIIDQRRASYRSVDPIEKYSFPFMTFRGSPLELRDVQINGINAALASPSGMLILATGAGKTVLAAILGYTHRHLGRTLIIVPSVDLVNQTLNSFRELGIPDCGEFHGGGKTVSNIMVGTWQSLIRYPEAIEGVVCLIADECHEYDAKEVFEYLTTTCRNVPFRYGITGTLPKDELARNQLKAVLGDVLYTKVAHELQAEGVLTKCDITIMQTQEDPELQLVDHHAEQQFLLFNPARRKFLADTIARISGSGNTLVVIDHIDLGEYFEANIPECTFISGPMSSKNRMKHYARMEVEDNQVLVATRGVIKRGIDISRIFNVVLLEIGQQYEGTIQMVGRGLRLADDKEIVNIYDICADTKYSKTHLRKRKTYYTEARYPFKVIKVTY